MAKRVKGKVLPTPSELIEWEWWWWLIPGTILWVLAWTARKIARGCVVWWRKSPRSVFFALAAATFVVVLIAVIYLLSGGDTAPKVVTPEGGAIPETVDVDFADVDIEASADGDVNINVNIANPWVLPPRTEPLPPEIEPPIEPPTEPSPEIVGHITHEQMIYLLRDIFPFADQRGAEEQLFDVTTIGDIEYFLSYLSPGVFDSQGDYVAFLIGEFSLWTGGENIPIIEVKESDGEMFAVTIVSGGDWQDRWIVLKLAPDGTLTAMSKPDKRDIIFVVAH
jgi:hypothetical protein